MYMYDSHDENRYTYIGMQKIVLKECDMYCLGIIVNTQTVK